MWLKNREGVAIVAILAIVAIVAATVVVLSRDGTNISTSIPPDRVETISVRRYENEPSFEINPTSDEGRLLLSKCEDVLLSSLWGIGLVITDNTGITSIRSGNAYVEIIFKDNYYDVPIIGVAPLSTHRTASRVLFALSGEYYDHVFFRAVNEAGPDTYWATFSSVSDKWGELENTVHEIQMP